MNKNYLIRKLLDEALNALVRIDYIDYNSPMDSNKHTFFQLIRKISPLIQKDYPRIYDIQQDALEHLMLLGGCINAYHFGDIRTTLEILDILYPHYIRKVFISHSHKDKNIINQFITQILITGCGLRPNDIFCTLDHSSIRTGEDFRNEIIRNMKECDYIFLMISNNYKQSEVCQSEMGASWALRGKRVMPFILPDCNFENMGFIYNVKQGASIIDSTKLDELYTELCSAYDIPQDWIHFNQMKSTFIKSVSQQTK